jgi:hypothetical protein
VPDYHFYLLGDEGEILRAVDRPFPSDEAAMAHARSLLPKCVSVDVLRGALVLGLVERDPGDPPPARERRGSWLSTMLALTPLSADQAASRQNRPVRLGVTRKGRSSAGSAPPGQAIGR